MALLLPRFKPQFFLVMWKYLTMSANVFYRRAVFFPKKKTN